MKLVDAAQMREIERRALQEGMSLAEVMRRAGQAIADAVQSMGGPVLILAGPGNNGGDGLAAAAALRSAGIAVTIYSVGRQEHPSPDFVEVHGEDDAGQTRLENLARESAVIVDCLLGTGQSRPPQGLLAAVLATVNTFGAAAYRVAADVPTGVNPSSGAVPGVAFAADQTICIGVAKVGDAVYPGKEYAGAIEIADVGLGVPEAMSIDVSMPTPGDIAAILPRRGLNSNKGSFGRVVFSGGSHNFLGAPVLSALASYRSGAGLVELAVIDTVQRSAANHITEAIFQPVPAENGQMSREAAGAIEGSWQRADAFVFGPGMGLSEGTIELTRHILAALPRARLRGSVIDADGLNALAQIEEWWVPDVPLVLTPHPGEMSRLTGLPTGQIQDNRLAVARDHARKWGVVVVLKGAGTIVASPDGRASVNPTGGPNLAVAGTGDVLSGIIGGLLAQGCAPFDAAVIGVYLHGRAGDIVRERLGDAGTLAGDLPPMVPLARQATLREAGEQE